MAIGGNPNSGPEQASNHVEALRLNKKLESHEAQKHVMQLLEKAKSAPQPEEAYEDIKTYIEILNDIQKLGLKNETEQRALIAFTRPMMADLVLDEVERGQVRTYVEARLQLREDMSGKTPPHMDRQAAPSTPGGGAGAPSAAPSAPAPAPKMPEDTKIEIPAFKGKMMSMENKLMNIPRLSNATQVVQALDEIAIIRADFGNGEIRPDLVFEHSMTAGGKLSSHKMAKAVFGVNEDTLQLILDSDFDNMLDPAKGGANINEAAIDGFRDKRGAAFVERLYKREERADNKLAGTDPEKKKKLERREYKEEKTDKIIRLLRNKKTIERYIAAFNQLETALGKSELLVKPAKQAKRERLRKLSLLDDKVEEGMDSSPEVEKHGMLTQYFDPKNAGDVIKMGIWERIRHIDQWGHARPTTTSLTIGRETKKVTRFKGMNKKLRMNEPIRSRSDYSVYREMMSLPEADVVQQLEKWRQLGEQVRILRDKSPRAKERFKLGTEPSTAITVENVKNPNDLSIFDVRLGQHYEQELAAETQRVTDAGLHAASQRLNEALKPGTPIIDQMVEKIAEDKKLSQKQKMKLRDDINNRLTLIFNTMVGWDNMKEEEKETFWSMYLAAPYELAAVPGLKLQLGVGVDNILAPQIVDGFYGQAGITYSMNFGEAGRHELTAGVMVQGPRTQGINPTSPFKPFATLDYKLHGKKVGAYFTAGANAGLIDWGAHAGVGYDRTRGIQHQWRRFMDPSKKDRKAFDGGDGARGWEVLSAAIDDSGIAETPEEKIALQRILLEEMRKDFFVDKVTGANAMVIGAEAGVSVGGLFKNALPDGAKAELPLGIYAGLNFSNIQREGTRNIRNDIIRGARTGYDHQDVIVVDGGEQARVHPDMEAGAKDVIDALNAQYDGLMKLGSHSENPNRNTIQFFDGNGRPLMGEVTVLVDSGANIPLALSEDADAAHFVTNLNSKSLPHVYVTRVVDQFTGEQQTLVYLSDKKITAGEVEDKTRFNEGVQYRGAAGGKMEDVKRVTRSGEPAATDKLVFENETEYTGAAGDLTEAGADALRENLKDALVLFKDRDLAEFGEALVKKTKLAEEVDAKIFAGSKLSKTQKRALIVASSQSGPENIAVQTQIEQVLSANGLEVNETNTEIVRQGLLEKYRPDSETLEAWSETAMGLLLGKAFAELYYKDRSSVGETLSGDQWRHLENVTGLSKLKSGKLVTEDLIVSDNAAENLTGGKVLNAVRLNPEAIEKTLEDLNVPAEQMEAVKAQIQAGVKEVYKRKVDESKKVTIGNFKDAYETEMSRMILESFEGARTGADGSRAKMQAFFLANGIDLAKVARIKTNPTNDAELAVMEKYEEAIRSLYTNGSWNGLRVEHKVWAGTVDSCYNPGILHDMELSLPQLDSSITMARVVSSIDSKAGLEASAYKSAVPTSVPGMRKAKPKERGKSTQAPLDVNQNLDGTNNPFIEDIDDQDRGY